MLGILFCFQSFCELPLPSPVIVENKRVCLTCIRCWDQSTLMSVFWNGDTHCENFCITITLLKSFPQRRYVLRFDANPPASLVLRRGICTDRSWRALLCKDQSAHFTPSFSINHDIRRVSLNLCQFHPRSRGHLVLSKSASHATHPPIP